MPPEPSRPTSATAPTTARPAGTPRRPLTARSDGRSRREQSAQPSPGIAELLAALTKGEDADGTAVNMDPVATVLECLEVAMMKLSMAPHPRKLLGTVFLDRTMPSTLNAAQSHLKAANAAKLDHLHEVEQLQEQLRLHAPMIEAQLAEIKQCAKVHRTQARQAFEDKQYVDGVTNKLQSELDATNAECERLRKEIDDSLLSEREAFTSEKARLTQKKAELTAKIKETREALTSASQRRDSALKQKETLATELRLCDQEAMDSIGNRAELKSLTEQVSMMQRQVAEFEAKKKRGKKKK